MRLLKILLLISFFFCFMAAGHGGGPLGFLEIGILLNIKENSYIENIILIIVVIAQGLGIYSLWNTPDEPDAYSLISNVMLTLIVLVATIISKDAIILVLSFNSVFLITVIIYFIKSIQYYKQSI